MESPNVHVRGSKGALSNHRRKPLRVSVGKTNLVSPFIIFLIFKCLNKLIYLFVFIFGCVGSLLPRMGFL